MQSTIPTRRSSACLVQMIAATLVLCVSVVTTRAEAPDAAASALRETAGFHNPFLSARDYLLDRQEAPAARLRLTYTRSGTDARGESASGESILTLADDWAMVEIDGKTTVHDFSLLRVLTIDPTAGTFRSENLNAGVYFRVLERENRAGLEAGLRAAGLDLRNFAGCDADTDLGIVLPNPRVQTVVIVSATDQAIEVSCDGRLTGVVRLSEEGGAPVALWPTISHIFPLHPAALAALRERGKIPTMIQSDFRGFRKVAHLVWTLASREAVDVPFPLADTFRNVTGEDMAQTLPEGLASLAREAANGSAGSGPPQAEARLAHLEELSRTDPPAAALALFPTIHSFPELVQDCASNPSGRLCRLLRDLPDLVASEPALRHALRVAFLDYENPDAQAVVLEAMQATRDTPHARDPNLIGIYGFALAWLDDSVREEVARQGFESDPEILLLEALKAYPYDPEYWLALAVGRLERWDFGPAFLFFDTQMSLPFPKRKRPQYFLSMMDRIRNEFPNFYIED